ncbi:CheR family methyltransferase [Anaeromyxobacter diazotrophicus]|uniref:protein-glutamate O-methyltransferase n=1 Tax=Anaeromyxobacter diazotrophicus TaxID=2590199 RepID=A0A7I9VPW8_9BACT|nr:protein-glutamate O-methyltransferase CheR [Anaeromyxobacter diazotrophicus]GEJ58401.1 chemotaxis protein methyltransferase [Anaeromyxobacter diazotrophicus]
MRREEAGAAAPTLAPERAIAARDFAKFQALIHREAGIWLAPEKQMLLVGRLGRRVRELGLGSFDAYYQRVEADPDERVRMLDHITTNETHFFREPRHFELLEEQVFPRWIAEAARGARPRRARVWSAACSTGEEPYSLAMALLRAFPPGSGWELEILATDLSTRVLERARAAVWPLEKSREIPVDHLKAYMWKGTGTQEGLMKAGPELRALVRFARLNLVDEVDASTGRFDLIFCRNVLIYFDAPTKQRVVARLLRHLATDGQLFLGHAESLSGMGLPVRSEVPTVYSHAARGDAGARSSP